MGLPAGEQHVLDTIENGLRITDQHLTDAFAAFTKVAGNTRLSGPELLTTWHRLIIRLRGWRPGWLRRGAGGRCGTRAG